jgi:hypothetical protein
MGKTYWGRAWRACLIWVAGTGAFIGIGFYVTMIY